MKTFVSLALTLVLTASLLVGCGCTNQNMDSPSAPTVLPTNEEIWNSTETTTAGTTHSTTVPGTTGGLMEETTEESRGINETEVQNHVNAHTEMMDKIRENEKTTTPSESGDTNSAGRSMPRSR